MDIELHKALGFALGCAMVESALADSEPAKVAKWRTMRPYRKRDVLRSIAQRSRSGPYYSL